MGETVRVGIGMAWRWSVAYAVLCFVTQIWAGSQFSPGQGGGLFGLVTWSVVFGVITVAAVVERATNGDRFIDPKVTMVVALVGHGIGAGIAVAWFSSKGGPSAGDWWLAPAFAAAAAAAVWVHLLAPRRPVESR